eukprot:CAMPEP_0205939720 /NCGR_PEP_ID=MMETSP1325-20131115/50489_1 /ASSEMBLY_ACC=CAM_ASM_000708 /TAXON_ID=236786 /ORGANISM="Florenciella sp., Strain RCC1007" /LENGTH=33 /DNA_ID= /DNA_START= /DNA_END= /DNA_ORIENTATION=
MVERLHKERQPLQLIRPQLPVDALRLRREQRRR